VGAGPLITKPLPEKIDPCPAPVFEHLNRLFALSNCICAPSCIHVAATARNVDEEVLAIIIPLFINELPFVLRPEFAVKDKSSVKSLF